MSELIKYANTDVLDGLKYVRVGLANIISHVINTGEDYIIQIPVKLNTLKDLLELAILKNYQIFDYYPNFGEDFFVVAWEKFKVEVAKVESGYRFRLLK
jgi:hypothetical protein